MRNLILFLALTLSTAWAAPSELTKQLCVKEIESFPIQAGGRVKPLYVHSKEMVKFMTGKAKVGELSALQVYCRLSLQALGSNDAPKIMAKIEHVDLQNYLKLNSNDPFIDLSSLRGQFTDLKGESMAQKDQNSYKKAIDKLLGKINVYNGIIQGEDWKLPRVGSSSENWVPLHSFFREESIRSRAATSQAPFFDEAKEAINSYNTIKGDGHLLELKYSKWHLFGFSLLACLLALGFMTVNRKVGMGLLSVALVLELVAMTMRVMISGRAPITNMYETVMFSGFGSLILAIIIFFYRKDIIFVQAGLVYNVLCLMMMQFANNMLSPSIAPLVPVLRDNFWLSTHVTCIIMSYGALALSWILSNFVIIKNIKNPMDKSDARHFTGIIHSSLKYGVVMLAAGIILGGVWADYSWGRFWGWDPKETWSLIVLLIYMAILHGRYTNWINDQRFVPLTALAFLSVMMAWFGVNYILASGLHSYGFSEGGAIFLMTFFATQLAILAVYVAKNPSLLKGR